MKHKLLLVLLTALIPCLFMQGCISNFEEDNTELSERGLKWKNLVVNQLILQ